MFCSLYRKLYKFASFRPKCFKLSLRSFWPDGKVLKDIVSLGAATFVTQISIVVMALVCNMTLAHYGALSAPIADAVAAVVILCLTVSFFKKLGKENWVQSDLTKGE